MTARINSGRVQNMSKAQHGASQPEKRRVARYSEGVNGRGGGKGVIEGEVGDPTALVNKIEMLERDLERRQESYVSRERAYKTRIDELEEELLNQRQSKTGWMKEDTKMQNLKKWQGNIINNIELVQDRTARILQEQERDLVRAFRARLFDVQTELEKEKSKKEDGAGAWIERSRQLEAEVEWAKEVADRLERVNQTLLQDNNRLKSQFKSQEEDRNFLIKQLVSVKKDNARLRSEYTAIEAENQKLGEDMKELQNRLSAGAGERGASPSRGANKDSKPQEDNRYKEVNVRMRKLLADERKSLQQVRQNYAAELKARTEMEMLLRQCVDDVRKEIARRHIESAQFLQQNNDLARMYNREPGLIPVEDFTQEDRERALELLLSQERVVTLLYSKTFPVDPKSIKSNADLSHLGGEDSEVGGNGMDALGSEDNLGRPNTTGILGDTNKLPLLTSSRPETGA